MIEQEVIVELIGVWADMGAKKSISPIRSANNLTNAEECDNKEEDAASHLPVSKYALSLTHDHGRYK